MFVHPWMIGLGALAATLPVVIHWLTRPRPVRLPLSTIRFVREAVNQRRARNWLRDILVLTLRTLAVLLLAAALARPFFEQAPRAALDDSTAAVRVVILDVSQSMAAEAKGVTALERGRTLAARELEFRPGLRANLLLAAARPGPVFVSPSTNFTALREALAQAAVLPERLLAQPMLNQAAEMLATGGSGEVRRELVIVSDFQRSSWASADFSALPADTVIRLASVAVEPPPANAAILRVAPAGRPELGQESRLEVDVGNYAPAAANIRVQVRFADSVYDLQGTCPPQAKTTLTTSFLPRTEGWLAGEARLVDQNDALKADDSRPFIFEVAAPPTFALVTRQAERQRPSSSYYLERALLPGEAGDTGSRKRVYRVELEHLDRQALAPADVVVLDHPGRLSPEAIGLLAAFVKRGKGVFIVAAENADAVNVKLLQEALGSALRLPVEFQPAEASGSRRNLSLVARRSESGPFSVFGDQLGPLLAPLRFSGALASKKLPGALDDEIPAAYADGTAFLVTAQGGSLAILNADLERSNLAASPLFVPLIGEVSRQLLARKERALELAAGEPISVALPSEGDRVEELALAANSANQKPPGELVPGSFGIEWRAAAAGAPGVYEVKRAGQTWFGAAVAIPASESDLRPLGADVFEGRLAGERQVQFRAYSAEADDRQDQTWVALAIGCLACLVGELITLRCFRN